MATTEEILKFVVQSQGQSELGQLAKSMLDAGQAGEAASPEVQKLVEEFGKLSQLSTTVSGLPALKAQLQSVGDELFAARQKAAALQTEFASTLEPTAALTRNYQRAQAAVAALEKQEGQLGVAIKTSENAIAASGLSVENLDGAERSLQGQMAQTRAEALSLAAAHREAAVAGKREALSAAEIAERNVVLRASFEQLKELLKTFAGILAFEQLKEDIGDVIKTGDKFEQWGIQFRNAFGGAEQGAEALTKVREIAEQTPLSLDEVTKAALQAKKEGLDPFNGSLQAIIATSAKYGGDANTVSELISALGKSANQGGLNIRTLTTLEQQGIPAAALLGEALGKTADQVTELAKQGKLGSDSVALLIEQLGKKSTGGLADEMGLVSTQVTKAHDNWDEFLELIAKSGAYEYVRSQLQALNQSFKDGLESGRLQQTAKSISDGLITLGQTLASITKFVVDNGSAILTVAEQYALFKGVMLGLDLLGAAQKFLGLAEATKAAGVAAELAAAENGGFGKLRTAINKIPRTVAIGISLTGVADGIEGILKLNEAAGGYLDLNAKVLDQMKDDAALRARLLALADQTAQRTVAAANTQIASADQLAAKNRDQSQAYIDSLQNAIRYYESIKVQDQALGDSAGAQAASDKVKTYSAALIEANTHQKELSDSIKDSAGKVATVVDRFDDLQTQGKTAATSIAGAFDNLEITTPNGLKETVDVVQQVSIRSKEAKNAVQSELVGALQKLNATDLSSVEANLKKLFEDGKISADNYQTFLRAAVQAQLLNLGATAQQVGTEFDAAGQKIIASFDGVASNARSTGQEIQFAFAQALSKVSTQGEVDALKGKLQDAFNAGRIGADQFSASMEAAGRRSAALQAAAIEAGASLDGMGTQGSTAAQNISNALQDARDKLVVQANDMARAIATALQQDGNAEALKAQLKGVEAQIASLNAQIANTGTQAPANLGKVVQGTREVTEATADAHAAADAATKTAEAGYTEWGDAADAAALATQKVTADTSHANDGMQRLTQAIADARNGFLSISPVAAAFFDTTLKNAFAFTTESDSAGAGFERVAKSIQVATDETNKAIANQRSEIAGEIDQISKLGTESNKSFGSFGDDADNAAAKMASLADLIKDGKYEAGLLGQADLAPLQQALEAAAQRAQQLADQTKQAVAQFEDLAQSAQDALDQEEGNQGSLEDRRHQKQLQDLQDAAKAAGKLNTQQYLDAVAAENKLHELKLQHIQQEQQAQNGGSANAGSASTGASDGNSGGIGASGPTNRAGAALAPINIHINGTNQTDDQIYSTVLGAQFLADLARAKANSL